ncbi:MAG: PAS domain S-box protein [Desulfobulbaceae bacterium]|nr:PAS domain S-box protein [Desulfobulbaceae bacterium]
MISFRIRTHLIVYLSVVTLLLTTAIIFLYTARFRDYAMTNLSRYGLTIAQDISVVAAEHIVAENYGSLQEIVQEFAKLPDVVTIEISDPRWTMLAATQIDRLGTMMSRDPSGKQVLQGNTHYVHLDGAAGHLIITVPVRVASDLMGHTRVVISLEAMVAHIRDVREKGALTGFFFWFAAVVAGYFAARYLTRPMQGFAQATERISHGDFNVALPSPRMVLELERFSGALKVMVRAIEGREQALRESENKLRNLFERAMDGIFVCDRQGVFEDVNPALLDILGYTSKGDLLARNFFNDLVADPEEVADFHKNLSRRMVLQGYELRLLCREGAPITVSLSCHAVVNDQGEIFRYEGMLRDITRQKNAAEEIASMRNYLNNIIESMPSMLIAVDEESRITQWNSAVFHVTGISAAEAKGGKLQDIAPFFSRYSDQLKFTQTNRKSVKLHREVIAINDDRTYNITFFPLVANNASGAAIRLDDITELEMKEKQLCQAQKMESVGNLAGGLAHDFNNVLGVILGNLSLIRFRLDHREHLPEGELREYTEQMSAAGHRAADLVRQLLTLSRTQEMNLVPVDLNLSIKHIRKIGENTFDRSVEIVTRPSGSPALIMGDPTQIEQVLLNLCLNSVHSMTIMHENQPWGGVLTIEVAKVVADEMFCKYHPEAREIPYWKLVISDTGIGMDTRTVSKIFDPFFSTKEKDVGTGLGLTMVYNIVKQLDGFIDVYSEPGHGSTFNVFIPLVDRGAGKAVNETPSMVQCGGGCILVVDDDEILCKTARSILESVGYAVLIARDGKEGVELYRENMERVVLVLLDMIMPVMSGREAYAALKKINPQVKVLISSGFHKDSRVEEVMALGGNGFLQKPYTLENLITAIQEVIGEEEGGATT